MKRTKVECSICGKLISKSNIKKHEYSCANKKQKVSLNEEWKWENSKYKCPYCKKEYTRMGICSHIWRSHTEDGTNHDPNIGYENNNRIAWNKGLNKNIDYRVQKNANNTKNTIRKKIEQGKYKAPVLNEEARRKISIAKTLNNKGGRCKWYKVSGAWVQGTWEKSFAEKLNNLNISWLRPREYFEYNNGHKMKRYTPDFYLPDLDKFIEIKGHWWGNDKHKMKLVMQQNKDLMGRIKVIRKQKFYNLVEECDKDMFISML